MLNTEKDKYYKKNLKGLNLSAKEVLVPWQKMFLYLLIIGLIGCCFYDGNITVYYIVTFFNILFIYTNSYRFAIMMMGAKMYPVDSELETKLSLSDDKLPTYTILIPLFKEAAIIPSLISSLEKLDYPKEKLQILLIVEEEDDETPIAIKKMSPNPHFHMVTVPNSEPQTKAKACNFAMTMATGDLTCIFDAEDRPDPMQLKIVANKFAQSSQQVACVQCRLCFYNASETLLTSLFEIEYQSLFTFVLPVATYLDFAIPLGGSSNHFRTSFLLKVGCWDPFNVTEDADLGLRLALTGHRTKVAYSYTPEEAPISIKPWLKQRSRWLKGYFHTFFIYFRYPFRIIKELRFTGVLFFIYIMLLGPLLTLFTPFIAILSILILLSYFSYGDGVGLFFKLFTWTNLLYTIVNFLFTSYMVTKIANHKYLRFKWLIFIFYFILHMVSAIVAIYKLIKEPHKWDKTTHGVTTVKN